MGNVLKTRLHFEGHTYEGEAMLELSELLFRGERRVVVPFDKITKVDAADGKLQIGFGESALTLELGAQAETWAEKIRNPKTVVQKLGVKAGQQVWVVNLDDDSFLAQLDRAGAIVSRARSRKNCDAIFYGAGARGDLVRLETLRNSLASNGSLWIVRPKGVKEITESDVMAAGRAAGLVDVKVVRFSDTHTAEKFVIPVAKRT